MSSSIKTEVRQKVSATFNFEGRELTISFYGEGAFLSRLVACWNACEDISAEALERGPLSEAFEREQDRADSAGRQLDELLAALDRVREMPQWAHTAIGIRTKIDAAIAKVKGGGI